ncbi:hypothetical protein [Cellulomonas xylanilytica]|uniref:Uncharacterized protein n=1 Tax=Cellulomonas xylanilytica TaxID=233583 RepID=A0A510V6V8_9CELL|nr:hypothetical protein [Cellulomonas xylanilytica]GEK22607.1 hypothetical protein CXY01_31270 [Cellulomonas xylanilytica]
MTDTDPTPDGGKTTDPEELAQTGGVGIGTGEPSTFEPEEDPDAVEEP